MGAVPQACPEPLGLARDKLRRRAQDATAQAEAAVRARAMVYHALAEALAGPACTEPKPRALRQAQDTLCREVSRSDPGIRDVLLDAVTTGARLLGSAACQRATLALAELHVPDEETLRNSYARVISSPGQRPLALYESLHRQGCLMGPATRDVERYYKALGLMPANGELPDHASVELALLGHLIDAEADARAANNGRLVARLRAEQRYFLRTHAGTWLPEVGSALSTADDPFYAAVGRLLSEFLSEQSGDRKRDGPTGLRLPALKDPMHCTLCGLCVGSCPLGALQVIESAIETALTLNPSQCVGCDRCIRICPEEMLTLSSTTPSSGGAGVWNGNGLRILRRSPRAACPNCGRPTVSQAELDAVFARLQPERSMQARLSLCVECKSWNV